MCVINKKNELKTKEIYHLIEDKICFPIQIFIKTTNIIFLFTSLLDKEKYR